MAVDEKVLAPPSVSVLVTLPFASMSWVVLQRAVGVVLAHLVELLLVVLNLAHELANVGQRRIGRLLSQALRRQQQGQKQALSTGYVS